jgi:hypothetical protein
LKTAEHFKKFENGSQRSRNIAPLLFLKCSLITLGYFYCLDGRIRYDLDSTIITTID